MRNNRAGLDCVCVLVCLCAGALACSIKCTQPHMRLWKPGTYLRYFLQLFSTLLVWDQVPHWTWSLLIRLHWVVTELPGSSCNHRLNIEIIRTRCQVQILLEYRDSSSSLCLFNKHFIHQNVSLVSDFREACRTAGVQSRIVTLRNAESNTPFLKTFTSLVLGATWSQAV